MGPIEPYVGPCKWCPLFEGPLSKGYPGCEVPHTVDGKKTSPPTGPFKGVDKEYRDLSFIFVRQNPGAKTMVLGNFQKSWRVL